ncbi:hypothetical protein [Shewanella psychrotolerans]|uniref:hypothetical protein n=1 Tax=Shewanella psychrotolerans TaxID=2864206 RepID=UPI001C6618FA|nr:hypothetical protein [Shewanella psychrotolerans]QYK03102.1 hypothetical protein K0I62_09375 [Shewanella psychrotolerans]
MQVIQYKGVTLVARDDAPTYQCKHCFKVWWADDFDNSVFIACQNCHGELRDITDDDPIET